MAGAGVEPIEPPIVLDASAGTEPAGQVHPGAVAAARRRGLTLAGTGTGTSTSCCGPETW